MARHQKAGQNLEVVKRLEESAGWEAIGGLAGAGTGKGTEDQGNSFLTKTLGGVHTLGGFQRVFRNKQTGQVVAVVHIGSAAWGWPFVAHGGLLATIMDECMGICASARMKDRWKGRGMTESLKVRYLQKVGWSPLKENFWVIRAESMDDGGVAKVENGAKGSLETLDGVVCVEAEGCYVEPRRVGNRLRP